MEKTMLKVNCEACGRKLVNASDGQFLMWTMSGDSRGQAVAFKCVTCGRLFCSSCIADSHKTCPKCKGDIINPNSGY
jgi:DNA-directed RNA polymerase subunit RPC12/RpoP